MTTNSQPDYEANIAANLARILQERANLNPNRIAQAMKARGVPMDAKAVMRIIAGERRIKFNEAACLMRVLGLENMEGLTIPPDIARRRELSGLFLSWDNLRRESLAARARTDDAFTQMAEYVQAHHKDSLRPFLDLVTEWASNEETAPEYVEALRAMVMNSAVPTPAFATWEKEAFEAYGTWKASNDE